MNFEEATIRAREKEELLGQRFLIEGSEYEIQQVFVFYQGASKEQLKTHYQLLFPAFGSGITPSAKDLSQSNQMDVYAGAYDGDQTIILPIDKLATYEAL